jgi:hypothetical protein
MNACIMRAHARDFLIYLMPCAREGKPAANDIPPEFLATGGKLPHPGRAGRGGFGLAPSDAPIGASGNDESYGFAG